MENLTKVHWMLLGDTDQYTELKKRMSEIVHDVVDAACIKEIVINDVIRVFEEFGFMVVKTEDENNFLYPPKKSL